MTSLVDELADTLDTAGGLVANVRDGQWSDPTPCTEWNVRQLVDHMIVGNLLFAAIVSGRSESPADVAKAHLGGPLYNRPHDAFRASADALLIAFRRPGVLEERFVMPIGPVPGIGAVHMRLVEMLVHGWDLSRATHQAVTYPDGLVEQELAFTRAKLADVAPDRSPFAPGQPVAEDAAPIDRLAACLGRPVGP